MLRLQFKPKASSRVWQNASLTMHKAGRANMEQTAQAIAEQEGWFAWRIVEA